MAWLVFRFLYGGGRKGRSSADLNGERFRKNIAQRYSDIHWTEIYTLNHASLKSPEVLFFSASVTSVKSRETCRFRRGGHGKKFPLLFQVQNWFSKRQ